MDLSSLALAVVAGAASAAYFSSRFSQTQALKVSNVDVSEPKKSDQPAAEKSKPESQAARPEPAAAETKRDAANSTKADAPKKELLPRPVSYSMTETLEFVLPDQCTALAPVAYGGQILAWIDLCAGLTAFKHCGTLAVTASMDQVHFIAPAHLGNIVRMQAKVLGSYGTSLEIGVTVDAENVKTGEVHRCCNALLVFVALGRDFKPVAIPALKAETPEEEAAIAESNKRRDARKMQRQQRAEVEKDVLEKKYSDEEFGTLSEGVSVASKSTRVVMTEIILPSHANPMGICFGGYTLRLMEMCATMAACRLAKKAVVTAALDEMQFRNSSKVGEVLILRACVNRVFGSSMEVGVRVESMSQEGTVKHCNTGYFTCIALDDEKEGKNMQPTKDKIRHVVPTTFEDQQRFVLAAERRKRRLATRNALKANA